MMPTQKELRAAYLAIPSLELPASWVIREKQSGDVVLETYNKAVVEKLNTERYEAVPILQYLQSLNK